MARLAIVTGGSRGIGRAISVALKKAGHSVVATYSGNDAAAREFAAETGIGTVKFDVGNFAECEAALKKIAAESGPIEILVNNAGITRDATLHKMTPQQWDEVIRTNLTSCFNMCRLVIDGMRERNFGRIVNIG
ncbi:MAG: SDR family NAD(P)-dependent oxidoreductase, partial [Dongiaceae bacterium]